MVPLHQERKTCLVKFSIQLQKSLFQCSVIRRVSIWVVFMPHSDRVVCFFSQKLLNFSVLFCLTVLCCRPYLWKSSLCGHMICSHVLNNKLWITSLRLPEPINHADLLDTFDRCICLFKIWVKMLNWVFHTICTISQISSSLLRYFPWVWSPCPTMIGSTPWTRGFAMGWASYPPQPPPCCGRRGSCQRPRAAATAHHLTGAQGSSHQVHCAGVYVCVCEEIKV